MRTLRSLRLAPQLVLVTGLLVLAACGDGDTAGGMSFHVAPESQAAPATTLAAAAPAIEAATSSPPLESGEMPITPVESAGASRGD